MRMVICEECGNEHPSVCACSECLRVVISEGSIPEGEKMKKATQDKPTWEQPAPVANEYPASWDLVLEDIAARDKLGAEKYGVRHQPFNGRDTLRDAYEEALDLTVYLRAKLYEEESAKFNCVESERERLHWMSVAAKALKKVEELQSQKTEIAETLARTIASNAALRARITELETWKQQIVFSVNSYEKELEVKTVQPPFEPARHYNTESR